MYMSVTHLLSFTLREMTILMFVRNPLHAALFICSPALLVSILKCILVYI